MGSVQDMCAGLSCVGTVVLICVLMVRQQKAVKDKGLDTLLKQARDENPLKDPPSFHGADRATAP